MVIIILPHPLPRIVSVNCIVLMMYDTVLYRTNAALYILSIFVAIGVMAHWSDGYVVSSHGTYKIDCNTPNAR